MILKKVKLTNCCQHKDRTFDLNPGINGVIGSNRAGKSNLIKAIQFAFSGDWPGGDKKERKITRGEDHGSVGVTFIANGHSGTIVRHLDSTKCSLTYAGQTYTKASEVNTQIAIILEASSKILSNYVFINQDDTTRILFEQPSKRAALFGILFGTDKCSLIREHLSVELQNNTPIIYTEVDELPPKIEELNTKLAKLQEDKVVIEQRLNSCDIKDLEERLRVSTHRSQSYNNPQTGLVASERLLNSCIKSQETTLQELTQLQSKIEKLVSSIESLEVEVDKGKTLLEQAKVIDRDNKRRRELLTKLEQLEQELTNHPKPQEVEDRDAVMHLFEGEILLRESKILKAQEIIAGFEKGCCPTCNTIAIIDTHGKQVDLTNLVSDSQALLDNLLVNTLQDRQDYEMYKSVRAKYLVDIALWDVWYEGFQANLSTLSEQLSNISEASQRVDTKNIEANISLLTSSKAELRNLQAVLQNKKSELNRLDFEISSYKQIVNELKGLVIEDINPLQDGILDYRNNSILLATINTRLEENLLNLKDLEERLTKAQEAKEKAQGLVKYRELVSSAHEIFHRDQYPQKVAKYFVEELTRSWNEILELLDVKFSVEIQDDMSIRVVFPDGDARIEDLSGGERCCASLSFLMAVNRQFAQAVGFMVLDEPTYGLDEEHMDRLLDLFQEMQKYSASTGLQILVVTHENRLKDGFTTLIEV